MSRDSTDQNRDLTTGDSTQTGGVRETPSSIYSKIFQGYIICLHRHSERVKLQRSRGDSGRLRTSTGTLSLHHINKPPSQTNFIISSSNTSLAHHDPGQSVTCEHDVRNIRPLPYPSLPVLDPEDVFPRPERLLRNLFGRSKTTVFQLPSPDFGRKRRAFRL